MNTFVVETIVRFPASQTQSIIITGIVATQQAIYVSCYSTRQIYQITWHHGSYTCVVVAGSGTEGTRDGSLLEAQFKCPGALASSDNRYLFVIDAHNIRKIDLYGNTVSTIAGCGQEKHSDLDGPSNTAGFNGPECLTFYQGNLFVTDRWNNRIRMINLREGITSTLVHKGTETTAWHPRGIWAHNQRLLITANKSREICSININDNNDQRLKTIVSSATFDPAGVVTHQGNIYFCDESNNQIKILRANSETPETFAGTGTAGSQNGPVHNCTFNHPCWLAVDPSQRNLRLYVIEPTTGCVRRISLLVNARIERFLHTPLRVRDVLQMDSQWNELYSILDPPYSYWRSFGAHEFVRHPTDQLTQYERTVLSNPDCKPLKHYIMVGWIHGEAATISNLLVILRDINCETAVRNVIEWTNNY